MKNWVVILFAIIAVSLFTLMAVDHLQRAKDQAATAETIGRLSSALRQYENGVSAKEGFFENLTVRNLTITDSNAGLRILIHSNDDGSAQISFYGEHSVFGGVIQVEKDGAMHSLLQGKPRTN